MIIGVPKEILHEENRVASTPDTLSKYIKLGFEVRVESSAGQGIFKSDGEYAKAGARLVADPVQLFSEADIILKVKQPVFNATVGKHEVDMLRQGGILITFLHPAAPDNHEMVMKLRDRNITAFTMDGIPRISRSQRMDALSSMSTVTGYKSVLMAANYLKTFVPMIGTAIGMIKPSNFLIIGTGVVGLQAIATAKRLGGVIKAMDIRKDACTEAKSLGAKIIDLDIPQELALGQGGYAKSLASEWLEKERAIIQEHLADADVVILSALVPGEVAPVLITEEMTRLLKVGAVVMDISIDQGGNCAFTRPGCWSQHQGIHVCGIQNIPGRLAMDASWLYANNIYHYVENLYKKGIGQIDFDDEIVQKSLVTHQGRIHHEGTLKALNGQKRIN
jgi:H+-translocating NAD(P) transhydrogenase subunit alpha